MNKTQRAHQMLKAYKSGQAPKDIAADFGVTKRAVYIRLNELGVHFENENRSDLWSRPDDQRRVLFAKKAARVARELLKAFQ